MKKVTSILLIIVVTLFSCQKESVKPKVNVLILNNTNTRQQDLVELKQRAENMIFSPKLYQMYNSSIFDTCRNEIINISGSESYMTVETNVNHHYYLLYAIDLAGLRGIGQTSGNMYRGWGMSRDVTAIEEKFLRIDTSYTQYNTYTTDSIFVVSNEASTSLYMISLRSGTFNVNLRQYNMYRELDGEVIMDNTGNPIVESCN